MFACSWSLLSIRNHYDHSSHFMAVAQGFEPIGRSWWRVVGLGLPPPDSPAAGENHLRRITEGSARDALLRPPGDLGTGETRGRRARGPFDTRSVMAMQGLSPHIGERNERRGSIALVLLVACWSAAIRPVPTWCFCWPFSA